MTAAAIDDVMHPRNPNWFRVLDGDLPPQALGPEHQAVYAVRRGQMRLSNLKKMVGHGLYMELRKAVVPPR